MKERRLSPEPCSIDQQLAKAENRRDVAKVYLDSACAESARATRILLIELVAVSFLICAAIANKPIF